MSRLKNALQQKKSKLSIPFSYAYSKTLSFLLANNLIENFTKKSENGSHFLVIFLKYGINNDSSFCNFSTISKFNKKQKYVKKNYSNLIIDWSLEKKKKRALLARIR